VIPRKVALVSAKPIIRALGDGHRGTTVTPPECVAGGSSARVRGRLPLMKAHALSSIHVLPGSCVAEAVGVVG
jgi:hypothetical protein